MLRLLSAIFVSANLLLFGVNTSDAGLPEEESIVINGSFETPEVDDTDDTDDTYCWDEYTAGSSFGGWYVKSGSVDHKNCWAVDGEQSVDISGCSAGTLYQNLSTVQSQGYVLRFALSGNYGGDPSVKEMGIWWGSSLVDTVTFDTTGYSESDMGWIYKEYTVTATSDVTRLMFKSLTEGCYGPVLDDVAVYEAETQTPTPTPTASSTGYISGRVTDVDSGVGISEATVSTDSGGYSATTDSIGSYQISNVAEGSYTLTASATGYESGLQSVTVTANAVTTANFELTAKNTPAQTGEIVGTVLDSDTGTGIEGATITTDTGGYSATADASGSFRMQNVTVGSYILTASATCYASSSQSVTVAANAYSTVNFSLNPYALNCAAIVFGAVEDEYGDYFEGVEVTISGNGYSDETETDEYGDYELHEVPAGNYTLTFEKKGYETQSVTITVKAGDMYEVDTVQMETEGEDLGLISGYAYDIDGEPVEDVKVTAKNISTGEKVKEYTDGDGFFEFEDMEPGTYKVSTKKKGYRNSKETVTLKSGQEKYIEFELRESSRNRLIIMPEEVVIGH